MKLIPKKPILWAGSLAAVLSLTMCDVVTVEVSRLLFPAKIIDFPMGEGKTISYPINSWVKKPYGIMLKTEYINYQKAYDAARKNIPYDFLIKCYRMENGKKIIFYENKYSMKNDERNLFYGSFGWSPEDSNHPDAEGLSSTFDGLDLSYGQYRCDFEDKSSPEIKAYLKEAGVIRTAIQISPYKLWFY